MFIFFDGEEVLGQWTATDSPSLYGYLAAASEKQETPKQCCGLSNELKRIDLLMNLVLIGLSDTKFMIFNRSLNCYRYLLTYEKEYIGTKLKVQGGHAHQATSFDNGFISSQMMRDYHAPSTQRRKPIFVANYKSNQSK